MTFIGKPMNFLEELERVARAVETAEPKKQRFNPRPAGVIRPGRSSEMVLQALRDHGGAMSEGQLRFPNGSESCEGFMGADLSDSFGAGRGYAGNTSQFEIPTLSDQSGRNIG